MQRRLLTTCGLWCALVLLATPLDALVLVKDGRPACIVVISDEPSEAARRAAADLVLWIEKVSGASTSVQTESEVSRSSDDVLVLVGDSKRSRGLNIDPSKFDLEEFVIRTTEGTLAIVGDDESPDGRALAGTQLGVDYFAEEVLGVRVLWPGELGEVVPRRATLEVESINVRERPFFRQHRISNAGVYSHTEIQVKNLGWSREEFVKHHAESELWFRFHRLGGSYNSSIGHGFHNYWARFGKTHPEWFALQPDGTRDQSGVKEGRARLCVSNRGLVEQAARDCIEQFRRSPDLQVAVISPTDNGGGTTYCVCEKCEAMDAPNGKLIPFWTSVGKIEHVSLTDRFVKFWNAIVEIVVKEFPDRYLGAFAYDTYAFGPVREKLHPNVIIRFVQHRYTYVNDQIRDDARASWLSWAKAAKRLEFYTNGPMAGHHFPSVYATAAAADMRLFTDNNLFEPFIACFHQHWATNGLNYYTYAKLLWNPRRNVNEIVDEYCRAGFGPAASAIRAYFDRLAKVHRDIAGTRECRGGSKKVGLFFAKYFDPKVLFELHAYLDEAARFAERGSTDGADLIKRRIEFLRRGINYTAISREYLLAKEAARNREEGAEERLAAIRGKRLRWFDEQGFNWSVNIALIMHYDL